MDEKSLIQALDRTQPGLPLTFGKPSTRTVAMFSFVVEHIVVGAPLGSPVASEVTAVCVWRSVLANHGMSFTRFFDHSPT